MDIKINKLYEIFLYASEEAQVKYYCTSSLRSSLKLKDFMSDLDPELVLDWHGESWYGLPELRDRIVTTQEYDVPIENTLVTAGTNEANFLVLTQTISADDEVVMEMPGWPQIHELAKGFGANVKIIKRRPELNWGIDLDELKKMVTSKTKLIFLNSPNNPTGAIFNESELKRICDIAAKQGAYLLCDEVYRGLEWEEPKSPAAVNYYERAISTASVSKTMGLQGIRLGWMATQDKDLLHRCLILREDTSEVMNVVSEYIALAALKPAMYEKIMSQAKAEGRRCWPIVSGWIDRSKYFSWVPPKAGFLCFVKYDLPIESEKFCKLLLAKPYQTLVQPGIAYGFENYLRMGVGGGNADEIKMGLKQIDKFVKFLLEDTEEGCKHETN